MSIYDTLLSNTPTLTIAPHLEEIDNEALREELSDSALAWNAYHITSKAISATNQMLADLSLLLLIDQD